MGKGRAPCCAKVGLNKGSWTPEEDMRLVAYIQKYGHANWRALPKQAGLLRCGKSCRLRWINYLRPDLKRGNFTAEEEETIIKLHGMLGNKWSKIAACLPGRTDNEIKNVWNTHLKKRVLPGGGQERGAGSSKKKKKKDAAGGAEAAAAAAASPSPSSSTTTNCSSGDSAGEQQSDTSKDVADDELDLGELEMYAPDMLLDDIAAFDFDMAVHAVFEPCGAAGASLPTSPCASSTSPPAPARPATSLDEDLLVLPEFDMDHDLWSIMDGDCEAPASCATVAADGNATEPPNAANTNTTTSSQEAEGKDWWLEDLERELGLWGPVEDYQCPVGPQGLATHHPDPLPAMVDDPVSCYFQAGPGPAALQEPGYPVAVTGSNQMGL